ncbi:DNA-binding protein [Spirochaetia bacterium]|nr:DNA-binding protein [Spirochaetia bacterium]
MTNEEKYDYWLDIAQYDIETAQAMFSTGRWLYVAIACQQAIEKLCKGLYTLYVDDNVPKIHNIMVLFDRFAGKLPKGMGISDETNNLFDRLSTYYLNTRYPEFKARVSTSMGKEEAEAVLRKSQEAFAWLLTLKP